MNQRVRVLCSLLCVIMDKFVNLRCWCHLL